MLTNNLISVLLILLSMIFFKIILFRLYQFWSSEKLGFLVFLCASAVLFITLITTGYEALDLTSLNVGGIATIIGWSLLFGNTAALQEIKTQKTE